MPLAPPRKYVSFASQISWDIANAAQVQARWSSDWLRAWHNAIDPRPEFISKQALEPVGTAIMRIGGAV